jgi:hypothetical protein
MSSTNYKTAIPWKGTHSWLGCVDNSTQPDQGAGKTNKAPIVSRQLIEARKDTTILLELAEETLNQVAFFVAVSVVLAWLLAICTRGNNSLCALLLDQLNECVTVVGFVGNHALGLFTDQ